MPGIADDKFLRDKTPMTKEEVRVLTLSKLRLTAESCVLDVGAGTGSLSVECALFAYAGRVYAVEKEPTARELIKANCRRFGVDNVEVVAGTAPGCLEGLPQVDCAVIGGSGGNLREIVTCCRELLKPGGRLVINAILPETMYEGMKALEKEGFARVEMIMVSIAKSRELGTKTALQAMNPVFIIWGTR